MSKPENRRRRRLARRARLLDQVTEALCPSPVAVKPLSNPVGQPDAALLKRLEAYYRAQQAELRAANARGAA